jgi:hypothetical protein
VSNDTSENLTRQYHLRNLATQESTYVPGASGVDLVIVQRWDDSLKRCAAVLPEARRY